MKSGISNRQKTKLIETAPEIDIRSRNRHGFCQAPHHKIDQINPRGPRKSHASNRTTHTACVRGRSSSILKSETSQISDDIY
jgi:hypothetical protein